MTTQIPACPSCDVGHLTAGKRSLEIGHEGEILIVRDLECYRCDECGEECVLPDQIRRNQILVADAKRVASRMLTGMQIRNVRQQFGLSQQVASVLFGGGPNAFSKYERGENIQSVPMDRLLCVVAVDPSAYTALCSVALGPTEAIQSVGYRAVGSMRWNDDRYTSRTLAGLPHLVSAVGYDEKRCA